MNKLLLIAKVLLVIWVILTIIFTAYLTLNAQENGNRVVVRVFNANNTVTDEIKAKDWNLKDSRFYSNGRIVYLLRDGSGTYIHHYQIIDGKVIKLGKGIRGTLADMNVPKPGYIITAYPVESIDKQAIYQVYGY